MDWNFAVQQAPQRNTVPFRFYIDAIHDPGASEAQGRAIYVDREMIEFRIPGTNETRVYEVGEQHKRDHPAEYAAFKAGQPQEVASGTPLKVWPQMTPAWIKMAAAASLHTVEQVAGLSDDAVQRLGVGWMELRRNAQNWLKNAEGGAVVARLQAQLDRQTAEIEALRKMVAEQARALGHADVTPEKIAPTPIGHDLPEKPKRRGRPPGSKNKPKQAEG